MTSATWDAAVPEALAARMNELLRASGETHVRPTALLSAAIRGLEQLIGQPPSQHAALDLLAIDGLVTAAFAATHDAAQLESLAGDAAARLMALGNSPA